MGGGAGAPVPASVSRGVLPQAFSPPPGGEDFYGLSAAGRSGRFIEAALTAIDTALLRPGDAATVRPASMPQRLLPHGGS